MLQSCVQFPDVNFAKTKGGSRFGDQLQRPTARRFPAFNKRGLVILGVGAGADLVRNSLYRLSWRFGKTPICDVGNLIPGESSESTLTGLAEVLAELHEKGQTVVVIGDSGMQRYAQVLACRHQKKRISLGMVLPGFSGSEDAALQRISTLDPPIICDLSLLATQAYYMNREAMDLVESGHYEHFRLGEIRGNVGEMEPVLRGSDLFSFDLDAVCAADAPDNSLCSPNGLSASEAAALTRYAGLSSNLQNMLMYGLHQASPVQATLAAQLIWYFAEGVALRYEEFPTENDDAFMVYKAMLSSTANELVFYRSRRSNRWWMEVPHPYEERKVLFACSYTDYQRACNDELPDRWWRAYQRML
jgi:formiminoglutamase